MSTNWAAGVRYSKDSAFSILAMGIYWVFGPGEQQVSPIEDKAGGHGVKKNGRTIREWQISRETE